LKRRHPSGRGAWAGRSRAGRSDGRNGGPDASSKRQVGIDHEGGPEAAKSRRQADRNVEKRFHGVPPVSGSLMGLFCFETIAPAVSPLPGPLSGPEMAKRDRSIHSQAVVPGDRRGSGRPGWRTESGRHGVVGGLNARGVPDDLSLAAIGLRARWKPRIDALGLGLAVKIEDQDGAVPNQPSGGDDRDRVDVGQARRPAMMTFDGGLQISFDGVHQGRSTALRLKVHGESDGPAWPASPGFGGADSVKAHVRLPRMFRPVSRQIRARPASAQAVAPASP
jgi:hypothetical protein